MITNYICQCYYFFYLQTPNLHAPLLVKQNLEQHSELLVQVLSFNGLQLNVKEPKFLQTPNAQAPPLLSQNPEQHCAFDVHVLSNNGLQPVITVVD